MVSTFLKKKAERRHLLPGLCYGPRALGGSKAGGQIQILRIGKLAFVQPKCLMITLAIFHC